MGKIKQSSNNEKITTDTLKSRFQKKLASSVVNMSTVKTVIPDEGYKVMERFYQILKHETDKAFAKKIVSYIIKIAVKVMIAVRNGKMNEEELDLVSEFENKEKTLLKAVVSFVEVDYTYDANYLIEHIQELHQIIMGILQRHSKPKTKSKIDFVFTELSNKKRLDNIFNNTVSEDIEKLRIDIISHITKLL